MNQTKSGRNFTTLVRQSSESVGGKARKINYFFLTANLANIHELFFLTGLTGFYINKNLSV
jgi:hypothetical protein